VDYRGELIADIAEGLGKQINARRGRCSGHACPRIGALRGSITRASGGWSSVTFPARAGGGVLIFAGWNIVIEAEARLNFSLSCAFSFLSQLKDVAKCDFNRKRDLPSPDD